MKVMEEIVLILMSVLVFSLGQTYHAISMRDVLIIQAAIIAHVIRVIVEMDIIVKMLTNVISTKLLEMAVTWVSFTVLLRR